MRHFSSASFQRQESTDLGDMSLYPPESALTWASTDARSVQEARIGLAFRNTMFGSASQGMTPELVLSPGSSLREGEGPIRRPNPTVREEIQPHSMYVDESGETYIDVHPDQFPSPPPLPSGRNPGVPKLWIMTGSDITSDTNRSTGGVTPQTRSRRRRNSYGSYQTEQPGSNVPSVVYGSDIVSAMGLRNLLNNPPTRQGTLRSPTIGDDFADEYDDEDFDMPGRSARSSQFPTTPLPVSARSARRSSSGRTSKMGEGDNGLSIVEEEGSMGEAVVSAVGGKRSSFAMWDKVRLKGAGKKVSKALSSRRSRRASSVDSLSTPLRSARNSGVGEEEWSTVPIMVIEPIPTSPTSAPVFPTGANSGLLSPSLLSPIVTDRRVGRRTDRGRDRGNGRGISSAVRGGTRTRLVPRGPRSPENTLSPEERLPRAYMLSPESASFGKQD